VVDHTAFCRASSDKSIHVMFLVANEPYAATDATPHKFFSDRKLDEHRGA